MIQIASQPIQKSFLSHALSRSFLLSYFCYILVLIIPATILVNIQYSWPQYKNILINPTLTYKAYQLTCLTGNGQIIYNSNLQSGSQPKDFISYISVGTHNKKVKIQGQVNTNGIKTCSIQVYFLTQFGSSSQVLAHLPINFAVTSDTGFLSSAHIKGTLSLQPSISLSQSSLLTINQTQLGTYPFSFTNNFRDSGNKSITIDSKILYSKPVMMTSSTNSFSFVAEYQISATSTVIQASLMHKLRAFVPIFMYISLFLWWVIVDPLIDWMLQNKVYLARLILDKIKKD